MVSKELLKETKKKKERRFKMAGDFRFFDRRVPSMAIHSLFDKYDTRKDGKLDEKQMTFFLEEALSREYEQA